MPGVQGPPGRSITDTEIRDICASVLRGEYSLLSYSYLMKNLRINITGLIWYLYIKAKSVSTLKVFFYI